MRRLLTVLRRFVVIFAAIWLALFLILSAVLGLPIFFAFPLSVSVAGGLTWFAADLALLPEALENDARRSMEDRSRRSFQDEVRRQGPGPRSQDDPS